MFGFVTINYFYVKTVTLFPANWLIRIFENRRAYIAQSYVVS